MNAPVAAGSILVVEDNESTRTRISTVARRAGYETAEAQDGLDALKQVSARRFDAILLDLVMPNVDGWQFRATQLRHPELASIPTIIVTVQPLREADRYALRATDIIFKPFEDAQLLEALARACRSPHAPTPAAGQPVSGLFWSRRGEIACSLHAPEPGSNRWNEERWSAVPAAPLNNRITYRCQHCPGDGSPIDRSRRSAG